VNYYITKGSSVYIWEGLKWWQWFIYSEIVDRRHMDSQNATTHHLMDITLSTQYAVCFFPLYHNWIKPYWWLNTINKWWWVCCYHNCTWFWWMLHFLDIHLFTISLFKLAVFTKKLLLYYFRITSSQPQKQNPVITSSQHHLHILTSSTSQSSRGTSGWGDNHTSSLLWS
jgi:hypothetical protein